MKKQILMMIGCLSLAACGGTSPTSMALQSSPLLGDDPGMGGTPVAVAGDVSFAMILNNLRVTNGDAILTYNPRIDAAAQAHADDMVARDFFAHVNPDGDDVQDRLIAQGYDPRAWGENIAGRMQTEQAALDAWIASPSHNALLEADTVGEFGLGVAGSGSDTRWVLVMATEK